MFTNAFLKFLSGVCRNKFTVLRQRKNKTSTQRIEKQAVCNRVNQATGDSADSWKRFKSVARHCER
jgi:hypothetical protein